MSAHLISIDPGLRCCGVALFRDGRLVACDAVSCDIGAGPTQRIAMARAVVDWVAAHAEEHVEHVVIELMVVRKTRGKSAARGDVHGDLIQLSHVTGAIWYALEEAYSCSVSEIDPGVWTKGFKKDLNHPRIAKRLSTEETEVVSEAGSYTVKEHYKEIWDAVGIGLDHVGRL